MNAKKRCLNLYTKFKIIFNFKNSLINKLEKEKREREKVGDIIYYFIIVN